MAIPMPTLTLRGALDSDPFDSSPIWTTFPAPRSVTIKRSRQQSLAQFEPGTGNFTMRNTSRDFDPWHTSGTYGSKLQPRKKINYRATWLGVTFDIFTGYLKRIVPLWPSEADADVRLEVVDAFRLFGRKNLLRTGFYDSILAHSPRAYYRMGDSAGATTMTDLSGNGRHGSYVGSGGKKSAAGALVADADTAMNTGNSERSAVGATAAGVSGAGTIGVEMFVRPLATPPLTGNFTLFDQTIGGSGERLLISMLDSSKVRVDTVGGPLDSVTTLVPDRWNHIVFTLDSGSVLRLRVNGTAVVTLLVAPFTYVQNAPHIGEDVTGAKDFVGDIDEVVIYAGTIPSDADTLAHYNESLGTWGGQRTDQRITKLLDQIGWPAGDRDFSANGVYTVAPVTEPLAGTSFLQHMQEIIRTEYGLLFMNGAGEVAFRPEVPTSAPSSLVTFGDGAGETHYVEGPGAEYGDDGIYNEVHLTGVAVPEVTVKDDASAGEWGPSTLSQDRLWFVNQADMSDRADRLLADRKDPKKRISTIKVRAQDDTANNLPAILSLELGDTVTVKRRPVGGGSPISVVSLIDGITHTIGPDTWVTEYALSPW